MAKDNFAACLACVLQSEGGWSDDPRDPGGATNKGITLATYQAVRPGATKADLKAISDEMVSLIYKNRYWDKVRGDDLPDGLDLVAFDAAVNSGVWRGSKWLQSAVGATADGEIGTKTIRAAKQAKAADAIRRAVQARKNFLLSLKTWPTYGKGWSSRLVRVEALAIKLAGAK